MVEKDGSALVMPALPGSGKSTLCAALMLRGWRLLSDEFGLIRPDDPDLRLHPLPRPIPLKNASIEVIRVFPRTPSSARTFPKTRKGDVAHLAGHAQTASAARQETAPARLVAISALSRPARHRLEPLARGWTFLKISGNSFNYQLQGARRLSRRGRSGQTLPGLLAELQRPGRRDRASTACTTSHDARPHRRNPPAEAPAAQ